MSDADIVIAIDLTASTVTEDDRQPTERERALRKSFGYKRALIQPSQVLGTGSYGSVVKAMLDDLPCAAKILHHAFFTSDDPHVSEFIARFEQECRILRHLRHPCIVQFLGAFEDPQPNSICRPILLMELMEESLTHFLESSQKPLPYHIQVNLVYDIASALAYLHANGVQHRDLSSNNILLIAGSRAKLTDFGMSKMVDINPRMTRNKHTECPGTLVFMPPEALLKKPVYSNKIDVFSTGVLTVQIVTRQYPNPTDPHNAVEDPNYGTTILIPVPELERRRNDLCGLFMTHPLQPIALKCINDKEKDRPTAAVLCQLLVQLKATPVYAASQSEFHQQVVALPPTKSTLEMRDTEIAMLDREIESLTLEKKKLQIPKLLKKKSTSKFDASIALLCQRKELLLAEKKCEEVGERKCVQYASENSRLKEMVERLEDENAKMKKMLGSENQKVSKPQGDTKDCDDNSPQHMATIKLTAGSQQKSPKISSPPAEMPQNKVSAPEAEGALYNAAHRGDVSAVKRLISNDVNVDCISPHTGWTPLMKASFEGHTDIMRLLIEAKAQINKQKEDGRTALHLAAQEGRVDVVRLLIETQAQVNIQDEDGRTALYIASLKGHGAVVSLLFQNHADINICMENGWTPLMKASLGGHVDIVRLLIEAKAQINTQGEHGWTALHLAAHEGRVDVVRLLTEAQAQVNIQDENDRTALYMASWKGRGAVVNLLLQNHADINISIENGLTPLMKASFEGHVDIVRLLIEANYKAQINTRQKDGLTALHLAAQEGRVDVVRLLTEAQAQVNIQDENGVSPLFFASQEGHCDVVDILLKNRANINQATQNGASPLYIASQKGHCDVVDILLKNGANINQAMQNGLTPLCTACNNGQRDVVATLIRNGADINLGTKNGASPLYIASQKGHCDVVDVLLKNGANINQAMQSGASPLFIASQEGHCDVVDILLKNGASINQAMQDGASPLYIASQEGHCDVVDILLKNGVNINQALENGLTSLCTASISGRSDVVATLIRNGVDINLGLKDGRRPIDFARRNGHADIVQLLLEKK